MLAADDFGWYTWVVGNQMKGTDAIKFIYKSEILLDRFNNVIDICFMSNVRLKEVEAKWIRATVGILSNIPRRWEPLKQVFC